MKTSVIRFGFFKAFVIIVITAMIGIGLAGCGGDGSIRAMNAADFGPEIVPTSVTIDVRQHGKTALYAYLKGIEDKPGNYAVTVKGDGHLISTVSPYDPSFTLEDGVTISLRGDGSLIKTDDVLMWNVRQGAKLILRGPTLDGNGKDDVLVNIYAGEFVMEYGTIRGANGKEAVSVNHSGLFTMNGGSITNNLSSGFGGGVNISAYSLFTMNGGSITNNSAAGDGGGVYVGEGSFIMNGGTIANNSVASYGYGRGGGVSISGSGGDFTMNGGTITNNSSDSYGGGVDTGNGSFIMNGGSITNNSAAGDGGGVYVGSEFTKTGNSSITGNKVTTGNGKAIFVYVDGTNDRYREADAGTGVNITIPSDETNYAQGAGPWL